MSKLSRRLQMLTRLRPNRATDPTALKAGARREGLHPADRAQLLANLREPLRNAGVVDELLHERRQAAAEEDDATPPPFRPGTNSGREPSPR